jgi:uncharacterized Fe-S cluster-containing radical SAM superfamily protein
VLGNVGTQTIAEIVDGEPAHRLRAAIGKGDLSVGCEFCAHAIRSGDHSTAYARRFDDLPVLADGEPPVQIEIAPSNTCNLQCVMCNGEWSSSIRARREKLPPLPKVYGDEFFDELAGQFSNLRRIELYGGEPFLARESLRLLDLLVARAPHVAVSITTNGTIWNDRVERLLDALPISIMVSVDGCTKETFESIRVGASWDDVQANIARFRAACDRSGTSFGIAHCLMVQNWHEFPDLVRWTESMKVNLFVNTVDYPFEVSLFALPADDLRAVVDQLGRADRDMLHLRPDWSAVWSGQLRQLRQHLAGLEDSASTSTRLPLTPE